jgi:hypothetical protein
MVRIIALRVSAKQPQQALLKTSPYLRLFLQRIFFSHLTECFDDILLIILHLREESSTEIIAHQYRFELVGLLIDVFSEAC